MPAEPINFDQAVEPFSGIVAIRVRTPEINDEQAIQMIRADLLSLSGKPGLKQLVLDMRDVEFLSSRALTTIVSVHRKLLALHATLILIIDKPSIREVFELTHLDQLVHMVKDEDELLQRLNIKILPAIDFAKTGSAFLNQTELAEIEAHGLWFKAAIHA